MAATFLAAARAVLTLMVVQPATTDVSEQYVKLVLALGEHDRDYVDAYYGLMPRERAEQRVRFFDQYRSYVINYNLGKDMVRNYIERRGGTDNAPEKRCEEFESLLSSPRLPSGLR